MTDQERALRLADDLDAWTLGKPTHHREAAAELRRLHAENERLHQINQSHEMKLSVRGYEIQIEDLRLAHAELRERNAELLEALKMGYADTMDYIQRNHLSGAENNRWLVLARAAIAKAEGGQT
jgi:hypothetical protein